MALDQTWTTVVTEPDGSPRETPTEPQFRRAHDHPAQTPARAVPGRPSARRSEEERLRRHRERAIAAWLRDLSR